MSTQKTFFVDINNSFACHPITGELLVVKNIAAIKQSVKNLVLTNFMDRPFQPALYSDVVSCLFDNITPITIEMLKIKVEDVIKIFEPRVNVLSIDVNTDNTVSYVDDNIIKIIINFEIISTGQISSVDVFLREIR